MVRHLISTVLIAVAAFTASALSPLRAETVFVLDLSRPMWIEIGGVPKATMVRNALVQSFTANTGVSGAIVAFGHSKAGACDDAATIKPMGPLSEADASALTAFKPKGAGALAAGLDAARLANPGARNFVVIAGRPDGCKADPCAVAQTIARQDSTARVNVIALDSRATETLSALSCMAEATNGTFTPVSTQDALQSALDAAVGGGDGTRLSLGQYVPNAQVVMPRIAGPQGVGPGAIPQAGQLRGPPPRTGPPGQVSLTASLSEGSPVLQDGMQWRVFDADAQSDGSYKLIRQSTEAQPQMELPPGEYLVNAAYGRANVTKKLSVWPGQTVQDMYVLNAGGLRLAALLANGQPVAENLIKFEIQSEATDQFGNRERVMDSVKPGVVIRLNSGYYHIVSTYGDGNARIESDIVVEPGKLTEAIVKHDAAKAAFRLVERAGGEALADTRWTIQTAEGDIVKESAGAFPSHILAAGTYRVIASNADRDYSRTFTLAPGETQQVEVVTSDTQ